MSMEISGVAASATLSVKKAAQGAAAKNEVQTGFKSVEDYTKYLQGKYGYVNSGTNSMLGVPVTVNVSKSYLQQCMNDPEKAAKLEKNLAGIPSSVQQSVNFTKGLMGNPVVTYKNYTIDESGVSSVGGCSNDPRLKSEREQTSNNGLLGASYSDKKAKKSKTQTSVAATVKKQLEKKRAAKKEQQQEWIAKQRAMIKAKSALTVSATSGTKNAAGQASHKKGITGVDVQA